MGRNMGELISVDLDCGGWLAGCMQAISNLQFGCLQKLLYRYKLVLALINIFQIVFFNALLCIP